MLERWRPIFRTGYEVSDQGRIRQGQNILKLGHTVDGYPRIGLKTAANHWRPYCVHTLVLTAFVGPRPAGLECRHLNGNPSDNRLENLVWGTRRENVEDRYTHGRGYCGERHLSAKLTWEQVDIIRAVKARPGINDQLADLFDVSSGLISLIRLGKRWRRTPVV
jgi:hypothetical protein